MQRLSADDSQAVADALAINILALLAALPPHGRLPQLAFLSHIHPEDGSSCGQWRMRLLIAEQLAGIAALLERQGLAEVLLPATLRLCEDPVAAVREAAAAQLGCMLRSLLSEMGEHGEQGGSAAQPPAGKEQQDGGDAGGAALAAVQVSAGQQEARQQADEQTRGAEDGQQEEQGQQQPEEEQAEGRQPEAGQEQQQQGGQPAEGDDPDELEQHAVPLPGNPGAVAQQIVQHLVELRRSGGHRSRQTYLVFCAALLLPQPAPASAPASPRQGPHMPQPAGGSPLASAVAAAVAASPGRPGSAAAEQAQPAAEPSWPPLPEAVVQSGITQGLLEGAVALAADPVPNVRLAVARLLAALRRQQPALVACTPKVEESLAALAADSDRDVQAAAAGDR